MILNKDNGDVKIKEISSIDKLSIKQMFNIPEKCKGKKIVIEFKQYKNVYPEYVFGKKTYPEYVIGPSCP